MNRPTVVNPKMLKHLSQFFPSLAQIQALSDDQDDYHGEVQNFTTIHADVPCAMAPLKGAELRTPEMTYAAVTHKVALAGYFPDVTEAMQVVVDGQALDIQVVEHASLNAYTRLMVRLVR